MFVFLSSSLNVELVYSILKGVTSFGYITLMEANNPVALDKIKKMAPAGVGDGVRITINKIKIKDQSLWDQTRYRDFVQNNWVKATRSAVLNNKETNIVMDVRVSVTFHMIADFQRLYNVWGIDDFDNFYSSLSPKFNRDMIFKAGEGAGRSGSFFFFSHDQKFVVKTITSAELALVKKMMPQYATHLTKNRNSLLSKILGIFTVKAAQFSEVHIILMENTVRLKNPK